jgi:hypothetical protein
VTERTPDQEKIAAADRMTGMLQGVRDQLGKVNDRQDRAEEREKRAEQRNRRRWHIVLAVVASLMIDLTVTGLFINNNIRLDHATKQLRLTTAELQRTRVTVKQLHQSNLTGCRLNNDSKTKQLGLWVFINDALQPKVTVPPEQRKKDLAFLALLRKHEHQAYPLRDCQKAYSAVASTGGSRAHP